MFAKLKQILKPENMMFKMVALNCGILLLVTILITTTGNVIYQNSMEKVHLPIQWKYKTRC